MHVQSAFDQPEMWLKKILVFCSFGPDILDTETSAEVSRGNYDTGCMFSCIQGICRLQTVLSMYTPAQAFSVLGQQILRGQLILVFA